MTTTHTASGAPAGQQAGDGFSPPATPGLHFAMSVTMPWPPAQLSPNFRTRRHSWVSRKRKEYRQACADAAWRTGARPGRDLRLAKIIFHPPDARNRDDDNLTAAFKAGRDGLAEAMGVDDATFNGVPHEVGAIVKGGAVVALLEEIPG